MDHIMSRSVYWDSVGRLATIPTIFSQAEGSKTTTTHCWQNLQLLPSQFTSSAAACPAQMQERLKNVYRQ